MYVIFSGWSVQEHSPRCSIRLVTTMRRRLRDLAVRMRRPKPCLSGVDKRVVFQKGGLADVPPGL